MQDCQNVATDARTVGMQVGTQWNIWVRYNDDGGSISTTASYGSSSSLCLRVAIILVSEEQLLGSSFVDKMQTI